MNVMLDLETLSTEPNAAIVQIAAVAANGETFNVYIDPKDAERAGLHVSTETISWWNSQPAEIRNVVMGGTTSLQDAIEQFIQWALELAPTSQLYLWSKGQDFDFPILRNAIELFTEYPFDFRNHRDLRTAMHLTGTEASKPLKAHDALSDALAQLETLTVCIDRLNNPY